MPNIFDTMLHEKNYAIGSPSTAPSAPPTEAPPYSPPSPRPTPAPAPPEEEPDWEAPDDPDRPHERPDVLPGPRNSGRIIKSNRNGFFKLADWHGSTAPGIVSTYDKLFSDGDIHNSPGYIMFNNMTQYMSPYNFNPLNYNPLREILTDLIDFKEFHM